MLIISYIFLAFAASYFEMSARAFVVLWYCCFLSVRFEIIFRADKNRETKIHFEFQQTIDTLNIIHVVIRAATMFDIWMIVQSSTIKTRTENGAGAVESCTAFNGKTFHYLCTGNVEPIGSLGTKCTREHCIQIKWKLDGSHKNGLIAIFMGVIKDVVFFRVDWKLELCIELWIKT